MLLLRAKAQDHLSLRDTAMNTFRSVFLQSSTLLVGALLMGQTHAGLVSSPQTCATADATVTSYKQFSNPDGDFGTASTFADGLAAKACSGAWAGNDMPKPDQNLGFAGDGLFNGEAQSSGQQSGEIIFPNGAFNAFYDSTDLNLDGTPDPGWIMVGRADDKGVFTPQSVGNDSGDPIVKSSFFSFTEVTETKDNKEEGTGVGKWTLTPDVEVVKRLQDLVGNQFDVSFFDGFSLVFKAGNAFSAYYFDLESLNIDLSTVGTGLLPYHFSGTYDVRSALDGKAISHISVYARDPASITQIQVTEPGMLALFGFGLTLMGCIARRRSATGA